MKTLGKTRNSREKLKTQGENSKLKEKTQNSRKKLKTHEKNSKLKEKTQVFGIFICWAWGKGGQTISLI